MLDQWTGRGIERMADGLIVALLARSTTYACAVREARLGYGTQAAMFNRSLFEDMVDAHWISVDPDTAEAEFADHDAHGRMLLADTVASFPKMYSEIALPEYDPEDRKRLDAKFGKYGQKAWSGLNISDRLKLVRQLWPAEHDREGLGSMHFLAHRENNESLHVSAQSLGAVVESEEGVGTAFRVGPRSDMVNRALFGSYWTFTLVIDHFEFPMSAEERAVMFDLHHFHKASPED